MLTDLRILQTFKIDSSVTNISMLDKLSVRDFTPQTAKKGKQITERKKELRDEFLRQNKNLENVKEKCKSKKLSINVSFYLNNNTPDKSSFKKDLDNLLKILLDVLPEHMDDKIKEPGLGIIAENKDDEIFEIKCHKKFVDSKSEEGIDVEIYEYEMEN